MNNTTDILPLLRGLLRSIAFLLMASTVAPSAFVWKYVYPRQPYIVSRYFHKLFSIIAGISIRIHGKPVHSFPVLFVSNHLSYLDIPVLGSVLEGRFVAKSEVAGWPFFGTLAKIQDTIFVERKPSRAAEQCIQMKQIVRSQNLILFAEGTSTDGSVVLPFKSSLFGMVENFPGAKEVPVQPITIAFTRIDGRPILPEERGLYAWLDISLLKHLWTAFTCKGFTVDVVFHPPLLMKDFPTRKLLALKCQEAVALGVAQAGNGSLSTST